METTKSFLNMMTDLLYINETQYVYYIIHVDTLYSIFVPDWFVC